MAVALALAIIDIMLLYIVYFLKLEVTRRPARILNCGESGEAGVFVTAALWGLLVGK